jgi:hypothetical protein
MISLNPKGVIPKAKSLYSVFKDILEKAKVALLFEYIKISLCDKWYYLLTMLEVY